MGISIDEKTNSKCAFEQLASHLRHSLSYSARCNVPFNQLQDALGENGKFLKLDPNWVSLSASGEQGKESHVYLRIELALRDFAVKGKRNVVDALVESYLPDVLPKLPSLTYSVPAPVPNLIWAKTEGLDVSLFLPPEYKINAAGIKIPKEAFIPEFRAIGSLLLKQKTLVLERMGNYLVNHVCK